MAWCGDVMLRHPGYSAVARVSAYNISRKSMLSDSLEWADKLKNRTSGLLGRERLEGRNGMVLVAPPWLPVMWMHTAGMRFPIDIVFLNHKSHVIRVDRNLPPWRVSSLVFGATHAIEMAAGEATGVEAGDEIMFSNVIDAAANNW